MTYVTGFFLVFAGMLIGYFLWYRDRTEEEQMRSSLERDNEDMRTSLKLAHNAHSVLDERFVRQKGQLNVLQQLCDDWSASRDQSERERAQLEIEIEDKRQKLEEVTSDLGAEKQKRISLDDHVHSLSQQHLDSVNLLETDWREKHSTAESKLAQRNMELKSAVKENEKRIKSLHKAEATIAELRAEIASEKKLLETATSNASGLKQEYVSLESSLKESSDLLKTARAETATALSEKNVASQQLEELQKQHESVCAQADEMRAQVSAMESLEKQVQSLNKSLTNVQQQLEKVSEQRDAALASEKSMASTSSGLQTRIDNQESSIHGLRGKHKDAMQKLKQELEIRSVLESQLEKQKLDMESRFTQQRKQLELHSSEMKNALNLKQTSLAEQLANQTKLIDELVAQRDNYKSDLDSAKGDLRTTQAEIGAFQEQSKKLAAEAEELKTQCMRISELESLLIERDERLKAESERLQSTVQSVESLTEQMSQRDRQLAAYKESSERMTDGMVRLKQEASESLQRIVDLDSKLKQRSIDEKEFVALKRDTASQIESLRMKLKASESTIRMLRRERAGVLARLANYRTIAEPDATVISFTQAMEQRKQEENEYDSEYGGHTRFDSVRGTVYTSAPESRDDLKRISGIAVVLEARLNDYGIYTFKQIMDWQPEAVEEFSRLLTFKDRIERDDWKSQAKFFYEEKTSQPAAA